MSVKYSVIMPCFNGINFISEAVESVIAQSIKDWELIIVDDGSTDGSLERALSFAEGDARITVLKTESPQSGAAHARNLGLKQSTGEFICFLDCDDVWLIDKLALQCEAFADSTVGFLCGRYFIGGRMEDAIQSPAFDGRYFDLEALLTRRVHIGCLTVSVRRSCIAGAMFNERMRYAEDTAFWIVLLRLLSGQGLRGQFIPEVRAFYRVHPGGKSSNKLKHARWVWMALRHSERAVILNFYYFYCYASNSIFHRIKRKGYRLRNGLSEFKKLYFISDRDAN